MKKSVRNVFLAMNVSRYVYIYIYVIISNTQYIHDIFQCLCNYECDNITIYIYRTVIVK